MDVTNSIKRIIFISIVVMCSSFSILGQSRCNDSDILSDPESPPTYKGLFKFLQENIHYPELVLKDKIKGVVVIQFYIDTNGFTSEHKIIKGIRPDIDEEVLRIAKLIKFDTPAMNRGKPIGICYKLPLFFDLSKKVKNKSLSLSETTK